MPTPVNLDILLKQAPDTAHDYFHRAIASIDKKFNEGYAKAHPELIGAFMQTAALDYLAGVVHEAGKQISSELENRPG